jgi:hypothetical protein
MESVKELLLGKRLKAINIQVKNDEDAINLLFSILGKHLVHYHNEEEGFITVKLTENIFISFGFKNTKLQNIFIEFY